MDISKTSVHVQNKMKIPYPSQQPPASSIASNQDLKDMDVLYTFKIKRESKIWIMGVSKTNGPLQTKIKTKNPI